MPAHTITKQQAEDWADNLALQIISHVLDSQFDVARRRVAVELRIVKAQGEMDAIARIAAALDAVPVPENVEKH